MPKKRASGAMPKPVYKKRLRDLQIQLVKLQRAIIAKDRRVLVLVEGRDAAGKDGLIKTLTEYMSPRETRIVALPKPSDRERSQWYFQRYAAHLPSLDEIVVFNRSWYNRAGVERVMGFCDERQLAEFFDTVNSFEAMLVRSGIEMVKYYLDISRAEQRERLRDRRKDPLTQWKISPIDEAAQKRWSEYTEARDEMLRRTHTAVAPWVIVHTDDKRTARVEALADLLRRVKFPGRDDDLARPDEQVVFDYSAESADELFR